MGYLSVILMEINITKLYRRNMILCTEWYGIAFSQESYSQ
jgi:hypothetical protein